MTLKQTNEEDKHCNRAVGLLEVCVYLWSCFISLHVNVSLFLDLIWLEHVNTLPLKYTHLCCGLEVKPFSCDCEGKAAHVGITAAGHLGSEAQVLPVHQQRHHCSGAAHSN